LFFAFLPKDLIGWYIMPLGIIATLWVLIKKIKRPQFTCYIALGVIWTIMAVVLDYFLLVKLLSASNYYKIDIFIYYILTLLLPIIVGMTRFQRGRK
jgi:hypothetical protein